MGRKEVLLAMVFLGFCFAKNGVETLGRGLAWAERLIGWDVVQYTALVVASAAVTGLPIVLLIWLVAKVWKAA